MTDLDPEPDNPRYSTLLGREVTEREYKIAIAVMAFYAFHAAGFIWYYWL